MAVGCGGIGRGLTGTKYIASHFLLTRKFFIKCQFLVKICVLLNNGWFPVNLVKTDSNKETVVDATETGFLDWSLQISFGDGGTGLITVYCVVSDGEDNCHYHQQNIMRTSVAAGWWW